MAIRLSPVLAPADGAASLQGPSMARRLWGNKALAVAADIGGVTSTLSHRPSTSQRWHSSRRRAPKACETSASRPSSSPIANTATAAPMSTSRL